MQEGMSEDIEADETADDDRPTWIPPIGPSAAPIVPPVSEDFEAVPPSRHRFPTHRQAFAVGTDD